MSEAMLASLFFVTYGEWAKEHGPLPADSDRVRLDLNRVITDRRRDAIQRLGSLFDAEGRLLLFDPSVYPDRPVMERQFRELCRWLSVRYLILAWAHPESVSDCHVSWVHREANGHEKRQPGLRGWRAWLRESVGDHPQNIRLKAPLARATNDYHLHVTAPPGHYVFESAAIWSPHDAASPEKAGAPLPMGGHEGSEPSFARLTGAVPRVHVYVAGGTKSRRWIDIEANWFEVPLGSMAGPTFAALLSLFLCGALLFARAHGFAGDIPPSFLVVALAGSLAPSLTFLRNEGVRPSLMSRVIVMALSLLAIAFAVWWAVPLDDNVRNAWDRPRYRYLGLGLGALYVGVFTVAMRRIVHGVGEYRVRRQSSSTLSK